MNPFHFRIKSKILNCNHMEEKTHASYWANINSHSKNETCTAYRWHCLQWTLNLKFIHIQNLSLRWRYMKKNDSYILFKVFCSVFYFKKKKIAYQIIRFLLKNIQFFTTNSTIISHISIHKFIRVVKSEGQAMLRSNDIA